MSDNIDLSVLDEDVSPDLGAYIRGQEFTVEAGEEADHVGSDLLDTPDLAADLVTRTDAPATDGTGLPAPALTTPAPAETTPDQDLRAQLQAQQQQTEQLRGLLQQQLVAAIRAEEQRFQESIQDLPDEERELALSQRRAQQAEARAQYLQQQLQARDQAQAQLSEESAKRQVAFILTERHGLSPDYVEDLMVAPSPQAMVALAERAAKRAQQGVQARLHPNALAAGGSASPPTPAPSKVQRGSGDLLSLIHERPYRITQAQPRTP